MAWVRGRDGHILTVGREAFVADPRISSVYSVSGSQDCCCCCCCQVFLGSTLVDFDLQDSFRVGLCLYLYMYLYLYFYMYLHFVPWVDLDLQASLRLGLCASWPPGLLTVEDMSVRFDIWS